ncbi:threonine aldolase family protein [Streptomyces sp. NPDC020965]|uniref:threonine aldolase family protein n=1 Tax=Streptomyces sp. NPDC020965 TaxID=3365105 RepID=UPI0037B31C00
MIDLRSDTLTVPSSGMLRAMGRAAVGDDNFREDTATNELEEHCAFLFGKEASLFTPTGTMSNQLALRVHTRPGDEVVLDEASHFNTYESAPSADLAGVSLNTVRTVDGVLTAENITDAVDAKSRDPRYSQTTMIALENTINYRAGRVVPLVALQDVWRFSRKKNMRVHLDGARLFNAMIASGTPAHEYGGISDTLSVCFAKGLGAPFGSILAGSRDEIEEARYYRKSYGGAMHQSGHLAAAALYALENNVSRLDEDHALARRIFDLVQQADIDGIAIDEVQSNIVIIDLSALAISAEAVVSRMSEDGVLGMAISRHRVRFVTHLGVQPESSGVVAESFRTAVCELDVTRKGKLSCVG